MAAKHDFSDIQECPTVYPQEWQFNNPIEYLGSKELVALGNKYGVIKVVPPPSWNPPFSISDTFQFHTRLQRLSDLGLVARSRKFFHDNLNRFLKMKKERGLRRYSFKLDSVEIYYYDLYNETEQLKPMDDAKWKKVATKFGYFGSLKHLKFEYETHIAEYAKYLEDYEKYDFPDSDSEDELENCLICGTNDQPTSTLLCDNCNNSYHMTCLREPLSHVPSGKWYCDKCLVGTGEYGFEEERDVKYTIEEFRRICEDFDAEFMSHNPGQTKTVELIERKFWDLIESQDSNLEVKYGADIHNLLPGEISGFPMDGSLYSQHPFNLTNLPFARGSLLNYIKTQISGMTVPWIYIGSLLSTFCWHVEDHHTLSANYCHMGATKKWYGIPSAYADRFEDLMKSKAPDLFKKQPDLLHQLVTLMSPTEILDNGIPCVYANQNPGEFVITYPRVYHSGFNCGFNFNEAVNFTTEDWLNYGGNSINGYKLIAKENVFDHHVLLANILDAYVRDQAKEFSQQFIRLCHSEYYEFAMEQQKVLRSLPFPIERAAKIEPDRRYVGEYDDDKEDESLCGICKTCMSHQYCTIENKDHKFLSMIGKLPQVEGLQKMKITHLLTPGASPSEVHQLVSRVTATAAMTAAADKVAEFQPQGQSELVDSVHCLINSPLKTPFLVKPILESAEVDEVEDNDLVKRGGSGLNGQAQSTSLKNDISLTPIAASSTALNPKTPEVPSTAAMPEMPQNSSVTPPPEAQALQKSLSSEEYAKIEARSMVSEFDELINEAKKHALEEKNSEGAARRTSKRLKKTVAPPPIVPRELAAKGSGVFRLLNEKDVIKVCLDCVQKHRIYGDGITIKCHYTIEEMQRFNSIVARKAYGW